jgi:hypothetical protein
MSRSSFLLDLITRTVLCEEYRSLRTDGKILKVLSQQEWYFSLPSPHHTDSFGAHQLSIQWITKAHFPRKKKWT